MDDTTIQIVDVIVAALIFISGVIGFIRGFTREVLGIISWVVALFVTLYAYEPSLPFWTDLVGNESLAAVLAVCVVFIGVVATLLIITNNLSNKIDDGALNTLDSTGGFLFGALRGFIIVCLVYLVFASLGEDPTDLPDSLLAARSLPVVEEGAVFMIKLLPTTMQPAAKDTTAQTPADRAKRQQKVAPIQQQNNRVFAPEKKAPSKATPSQPAPKSEPKSPSQSQPSTTPYKPEDKRDLQSLIEGLQ
jgi:membrane protein required for colicin V production